jgi:putative transposase
MLTQDEFDTYGHRLNLSAPARTLMQAIRTSPPSRRVRSAAGNVSVRYPSRKMGVTIQAESHKNELAGIYEMEFDPETLEYYDQPTPIKLDYLAKNGKPVGVLHTPDFFVLRTTSAGWEEWKMESELVRLAQVMPNRYGLDAAGHWRCPPGEAYAAPFGLFYRLRSSAEINWILQRNLRFLEDYLRDDCPPVEPPIAQAILARVASQPGLTLLEVLEQVAGASRDRLYTLIATGQVSVDLTPVAITEPERVQLFRDQETEKAYRSITAERVQAAVLRCDLSLFTYCLSLRTDPYI